MEEEEAAGPLVYKKDDEVLYLRKKDGGPEEGVWVDAKVISEVDMETSENIKVLKN